MEQEGTSSEARKPYPDLTLRESDIWVFNCNGSLYFVKTPSYDEAEKKCFAAQLKDGVKEPIMSVGHKILIWE
jgi:hypothetical protein